MREHAQAAAKELARLETSIREHVRAVSMRLRAPRIRELEEKNDAIWSLNQELVDWWKREAASEQDASTEEAVEAQLRREIDEEEYSLSVLRDAEAEILAEAREEGDRSRRLEQLSRDLLVRGRSLQQEVADTEAALLCSPRHPQLDENRRTLQSFLAMRRSLAEEVAQHRAEMEAHEQNTHLWLQGGRHVSAKGFADAMLKDEAPRPEQPVHAEVDPVARQARHDQEDKKKAKRAAAARKGLKAAWMRGGSTSSLDSEAPEDPLDAKMMEQVFEDAQKEYEVEERFVSKALEVLDDLMKGRSSKEQADQEWKNIDTYEGERIQTFATQRARQQGMDGAPVQLASSRG